MSFLAAAGEDGAENIEIFLRSEGVNAAIVRKREATAFAAIITDSTGEFSVTPSEKRKFSTASLEKETQRRFHIEPTSAEYEILQ